MGRNMFANVECYNTPRSRAIASRGLPSFNVVTVLTFLVSISFTSLCFPDIKK